MGGGGGVPIGYCFHYRFLKFFWGEQGCDGGEQSNDREISPIPPPPLGKTLGVGVLKMVNQERPTFMQFSPRSFVACERLVLFFKEQG